MNKKINLEDIAHELDSEVGRLLLNKIKINDIQTMAGHLSEDVENMDIDKFKFYYHEFSHRMRVIADFLHYVSMDLQKNHEEVEKLKDELFQAVVINGNTSNEYPLVQNLEDIGKVFPGIPGGEFLKAETDKTGGNKDD